MKADVLIAPVESLKEQTRNLEKQLDELKRALDQLRTEKQAIKSQLDKTEQKLADHMAHVEKWDTRRWGTIGFFLAGLITMIVNLILALTRK